MENYRKALNLGMKIQNRFTYGSPEYLKGERITAWACEKIIEMRRVKVEDTLYPPPEIGSMEEKIEHEVSQPDYWLD